MRTVRLFVAVAGLSAPLWVSVIDSADAAQRTNCVLRGDARIDPGLSNEAVAQTIYSPTDGTIECDGPVHGRQPTGPGVWVGNSGHFEGTCANGGKGTFAHSYRLPTKDGELRFGNGGPFTFGALKGGVIGGEFEGDEGVGTFSVVPKNGDCVSAPITDIAVEVKMTLK